jgi:hypothetical protein
VPSKISSPRGEERRRERKSRRGETKREEAGEMERGERRRGWEKARARALSLALSLLPPICHVALSPPLLYLFSSSKEIRERVKE